MIKSNFSGIKITGIAAAVPDNYVDIKECAENDILNNDFNVEKYIKNTGVKGKYLCLQNQTAADLCVAAAEKILTEKNINRNEIGVLIFVTQTPDYKGPATACVMQHRLSLSTACVAFDINLGCSGFCYGLNIVSSLLKNSTAKKALLLCGDISAQNERTRTYKNESLYHLFGDAGSAALIEKTESENDKLCVYSSTDGAGFKAIMQCAGYSRHPGWNNVGFMDGVEVFNFAISKAPEMLNQYMNDMGTTPDDYDKLVLHQANIYIMKQVAKRTGFSMDKTSVSIDKFANTSSASIPLTISEEYGDDNSDKEKRFLTCGFGVGLSWATVEFSVCAKDIFPVIYTNDWFDDGLINK